MYRIVAFSGGKDSTCLALRLKEMHPGRDFIYLFTPTGDELPEMKDHLQRMEERLGKLTYLTNHDLHFWIKEFNALPNWRQRWCTRLLKIEPIIAYMKKHIPCVLYVGLRADEKGRKGLRDYGDGCEYKFPLQEWNWSLLEVETYLRFHGIEIPRRTDCARCPFQRLVEWKRLSQERPELFESAIADENRTGHTYRAPTKDAWPAPLDELRDEFRTGRKIKGEDLYDSDNPCRVCTM